MAKIVVSPRFDLEKCSFSRSNRRETTIFATTRLLKFPWKNSLLPQVHCFKFWLKLLTTDLAWRLWEWTCGNTEFFMGILQYFFSFFYNLPYVAKIVVFATIWPRKTLVFLGQIVANTTIFATTRLFKFPWKNPYYHKLNVLCYVNIGAVPSGLYPKFDKIRRLPSSATPRDPQQYPTTLRPRILFLGDRPLPTHTCPQGRQ